MTTQPLVIWGASGHGKVVADAAWATGRFDVVGFIDDAPELHGTEVLGLPVLGGRAKLDDLARRGIRHLFLAIGDNATRLRLAEQIKGPGFELVTILHPRATISTAARIGPGTLVAAGAVVGPDTTLGACVIVNTLAGVDHDCKLADGVHIAPGAHLAGGVAVGRGTLIGCGVAVRDGLVIGAQTIVGAGAAVVCDLPDRVLALGVPAKIREERG